MDPDKGSVGMSVGDRYSDEVVVAVAEFERWVRRGWLGAVVLHWVGRKVVRSIDYGELRHGRLGRRLNTMEGEMLGTCKSRRVIGS